MNRERFLRSLASVEANAETGEIQIPVELLHLLNIDPNLPTRIAADELKAWFEMRLEEDENDPRPIAQRVAERRALSEEVEEAARREALGIPCDEDD